MAAPRAKAWMVLGTGSGVGKSFLTAGLCRILHDRGVRAAPFKAQNMSNNSFVTCGGGEMARAQAVQAECAGAEPSVHMNPVLLKPGSDNGSQVVIQGRVAGTMRAAEYYGLREKIWAAIRESYERLSSEYDVLVIEGAGSPAEINLKEFDLVNGRVAEMAGARCLLVGDIDRGGVFAWLWGTLALLDETERDRIDGLVINKFRGDFKILEPGLRMLEDICGKKVLGTIPYDRDLWIEEEDALNAEEGRGGVPDPSRLDLAVLLLPRISNVTDFQILAREPGVSLRMIRRPEEFGAPDLLILPGTKATVSDLQFLKSRGFEEKIRSYVRSGGRVLGICGGFQMLGRTLEDPEGIESAVFHQEGLGLLPIRTRFSPEKTLGQVSGRVHRMLFGQRVHGEVRGYEIHMGRSEREGTIEAFLELRETDFQGRWRPEGAVDISGRILGTYLHGLFDEASFRHSFLKGLARSVGKEKSISGVCPPDSGMSLVKERNYGKLATLLRENLDLSFLEPCWKYSSHSV